MPNIYAPYSTNNTAGVNIEQTYPPATNTPYVEVPPFALGSVVQGTDDAQWVFCIAQAGFAIGQVAAINPATWQASFAVNSSATPSAIGVANVAVVNGESFWAQVAGYAPAVQASGASAVTGTDGNLHTTVTAGAINAAIVAATTKTIVGIAFTTAPSGAGVFPAYLDTPMITRTDP